MMKKTFAIPVLFALLTVGISSCDNKEKANTTEQQATAAVGQATSQEQTPVEATSNEKTADGPVIKFEEKEFDFGTINEGDVVKHSFEFTNTGNAPLVIQSATAQCGCTVPRPPKDPIAPGAKGKIEVEFNSKGKAGIQSKAVTVTANTQPEVTTVLLKGVVNAGVSQMNGPVRSN